MGSLLGGRGDWQNLAQVSWQVTPMALPDLRAFAGRFNGSPGADLLFVDQSRFGRLYSAASNRVARHNLFAF